MSDYAQDSSERTYSLMIRKECLRLLTSTLFRRRPSRLTGQPFRLASKDPLPGAKGSGEQSETILPTVGHGDHHLAAHDLPLQVRVGSLSLRSGQAASPVRLCNRPPGRRRH
jgi:hypothetical protein